MNNENNPLNSYFRKPAIHMSLPSGGQFYLKGTLNMPETKELPVYPMSALDEISYKTPDALFNGSAAIEVIRSCVPAITDPWMIPQCDMTSILTNIRIASFGHLLEVDTTCPKCKEISTYNIDLRHISDSMKMPDYGTGLEFGALNIFFKPLNYKQVNEGNKKSFEEQQLSKAIIDSDLDENEKISKMTEAFNSISKYTIESLADSILVIRTPDSDVTDRAYIIDYLKNCERAVYQKIKDEIITQRRINDLKPLKITCDNKKCKHEYEQPFTLDMSSFFE